MEAAILGMLLGKPDVPIRHIQYYEISSPSLVMTGFWFVHKCFKVNWVDGFPYSFGPPPESVDCMTLYSFYCEPCTQDEQTVINRSVKITSVDLRDKMCKKWCGNKWKDFER